MKQIRLSQPASLDQLKLVTSAEPRRPGPGEVLVRVHASSLNFHDYAVVVGRIPAAEGRVPMSDGAGEVVEVGPALDTVAMQAPLAAGDRVISLFFPRWQDGGPSRTNRAGVPGDHADGYAAEYVTVPAYALTRQPKGYSHAQAATLPCAALTAWRALIVEGPVQQGEVVVVQGTGGVSLFALQFAKLAGATVIATSSSDEKLERLRQLGADHLINYRTQPKWARTVTEITEGEGADHVVEVGGPETLVQSIHACRSGGHISMIGVLTGVEGKVSTATIMSKNIRLKGITVGSCRHQLDMIRAIDANGLQPVIDSHFPLERIADAFRHQESNKHFGKIVLDI
ncbi:MAG: NAD(P)-dependent alcohol dehydrogenase [Burkholderiaceae bacterium]|nr:NAD(P)-dependent alcohol dehydrogenase [Burkholderiaceae bacterium]